jgi:hypothetical protein
MTDNFGASGEYPDGKISKSDEGELTLGVTYDPTKDLVIINFGKPVAWLGLKPAQAAAFAQFILKRAQRKI